MLLSSLIYWAIGLCCNRANQDELVVLVYKDFLVLKDQVDLKVLRVTKETQDHLERTDVMAMMDLKDQKYKSFLKSSLP